MANTLANIKNDLSKRILSNELLPDFIYKQVNDGNTSLQEWADAIAEFWAVYFQKSEMLLDIYNDGGELLDEFLNSKNFFTAGTETSTQLKAFAKDRLKYFLKRGSLSSIDQIQLLTSENINTKILNKDVGNTGFVCGRSSPMYRNSLNELNLCYLNVREMIIFNIDNQSVKYDDGQIKNIIDFYFRPIHIRSLIHLL